MFGFAALKGWRFWSPSDALFHRDPPVAAAQQQEPQQQQQAPIFWARGNGWALGALAAALEFTPRADPHRAVYADLLQRHAARLAQLQGADGCWRVSLTDPNFNPTPETTGTAMFAYGMAYGVRTGLLARDAYEPVVARAWQCLTIQALQPSGRVGFCQPVGMGPHRNFDFNSTSSFCAGQFALAAAEVAQLSSNR
jgi:rhamnogalacturonyl hydrolase YesR